MCTISAMRCVNTENNSRKYLRPLLFNAKVEENDLGKWEEYIELNFELPDPGPDGAVKELRKMVETRKTPDYKGGKRGSNGKPIPNEYVHVYGSKWKAPKKKH